RETRRVVLEAIGLARSIARAIHDRRVELTELVGQSPKSCNAGVGRGKESGALDWRLGNPAWPERLDVIDHDVVKKPAADVRIPESALDEIVLEVCVLGADHPSPIKSVVRGGGLLKHVSGDANTGAVAGRHPESQVGALDVELVLRLGCPLVAAVLRVCVQNPRKIHGYRSGRGRRGS